MNNIYIERSRVIIESTIDKQITHGKQEINKPMHTLKLVNAINCSTY